MHELIRATLRNQFLRVIFCEFILWLSSSNATATELDRAQWLERFAPTVINQMCSSDWYVRQCFALNASQCSSAATVAIDECTKGFEGYIPPTVKSADESARIGERLTKCAGRIMELQQDRFKRQATACKSLSEWEKSK